MKHHPPYVWHTKYESASSSHLNPLPHPSSLIPRPPFPYLHPLPPSSTSPTPHPMSQSPPTTSPAPPSHALTPPAPTVHACRQGHLVGSCAGDAGGNGAACNGVDPAAPGGVHDSL